MIEQKLKQSISLAFKNCFSAEVDIEKIALEKTSTDYEGDFTFVVFSYLKQSKKNPEQTANEIGNFVKEHVSEVASFNVIKGFLNFSLTDDFWFQFLQNNYDDQAFGIVRKLSGQKILVEYSSPNTNKPLHLGHVRNNLLGFAVSNILKANGHQVTMCNLVNDRGIHICKSMLAWIKFGNGETPESSGLKGDHLVGKYYVEFDKQSKIEYNKLVSEFQNIKSDQFFKEQLGGVIGIIGTALSEEINYSVIKTITNALMIIHNKPNISQEDKQRISKIISKFSESLIFQVTTLLQKWEAGDEETVRIWKMMNDWVYAGFDTTYKKLGVRFDKFYYESNTYILGKEIVQEGLSKNVFFKNDDGSVWVDLTDDGLDQKLLLRGDGTSVYITQDIGTAELKYKDFGCERSIYVVGNEQDYHFKVLQLICKKLGKTYADGIFHLSYGMVELPQGKMKSREGTVVDADDLMDEMINTAKETTIALGKTEGLNEEELQKLYETIGLGALKYFLLKVEPKRKMMFNPEESIDFQGNTGPFIQYTHARIKSILRNVEEKKLSFEMKNIQLHPLEKNIIEILHEYPSVIANAGKEMSPGVVANYVYELAKSFNHFYHELSILKENNIDQRNFRVMICMFTANIIKQAFNILGINVPERM